MTRISDYFPRKYLRAEDLPHGRPVPVTIAGWSTVEFQAVAKPVLWFLAGRKGLILNSTRAHTVRVAYGELMDRWTGRPLELFLGEVALDNTMALSICVRVPRGATSAVRRHCRLPLEATLPFHCCHDTDASLTADIHLSGGPHGSKEAIEKEG